MKLYTKSEVIELLNEQKQVVIHSLGVCSKSMRYPEDYEEIKKWMMAAPILLNKDIID